jgi:hypothetical protein
VERIGVRHLSGLDRDETTADRLAAYFVNPRREQDSEDGHSEMTRDTAEREDAECIGDGIIIKFAVGPISANVMFLILQIKAGD